MGVNGASRRPSRRTRRCWRRRLGHSTTAGEAGAVGFFKLFYDESWLPRAVNHAKKIVDEFDKIEMKRLKGRLGARASTVKSDEFQVM